MVSHYRPSLAKNMIRRSLRGIIDPYPTDREIDLLWQHFESRCAFCGQEVGINPKDAHIDHLDAGYGGGANHVSNRVLACASCNEKEKREMAWRQFLRSKSKSDAEYMAREQLVLRWVVSFDGQAQRSSDDVLQRVESEICLAIEAYDRALERIRHIRDNPT